MFAVEVSCGKSENLLSSRSAPHYCGTPPTFIFLIPASRSPPIPKWISSLVTSATEEINFDQVETLYSATACCRSTREWNGVFTRTLCDAMRPDYHRPVGFFQLGLYELSTQFGLFLRNLGHALISLSSGAITRNVEYHFKEKRDKHGRPSLLLVIKDDVIY